MGTDDDDDDDGGEGVVDILAGRVATIEDTDVNGVGESVGVEVERCGSCDDGGKLSTLVGDAET
jgi:hypothetical protein